MTEDTYRIAFPVQPMGSTSNLTRANLSGVSFYGANLFGSNLENSNLSHTLLKNANLDTARLNRNTELYRSNLIGADLTGVDLLSARIFPPPCTSSPEHVPPPPKHPSLSGTVKDVCELIKVCKNLQKHYKEYYDNFSELPDEQTVFYFRGQSDDSWDLRPSMMRLPKNGNPGTTKREGEMLFDLLSRCPEEFPGMTTALSQWVLAQHHGLKTWLLDITRNPLVGLFFASESNDGQPDPNKENDKNLSQILLSKMPMQPRCRNPRKLVT